MKIQSSSGLVLVVLMFLAVVVAGVSHAQDYSNGGFEGEIITNADLPAGTALIVPDGSVTQVTGHRDIQLELVEIKWGAEREFPRFWYPLSALEVGAEQKSTIVSNDVGLCFANPDPSRITHEALGALGISAKPQLEVGLFLVVKDKLLLVIPQGKQYVYQGSMELTEDESQLCTNIRELGAYVIAVEPHRFEECAFLGDDMYEGNLGRAFPGEDPKIFCTLEYQSKCQARCTADTVRLTRRCGEEKKDCKRECNEVSLAFRSACRSACVSEEAICLAGVTTAGSNCATSCLCLAQ